MAFYKSGKGNLKQDFLQVLSINIFQFSKIFSKMDKNFHITTKDEANLQDCGSPASRRSW